VLTLVGSGSPRRDVSPFASAEDADLSSWFPHEGADTAGGDDQALAAQGGQRVADCVAADAEGLREGRLR